MVLFCYGKKLSFLILIDIIYRYCHYQFVIAAMGMGSCVSGSLLPVIRLLAIMALAAWFSAIKLQEKSIKDIRVTRG